MASKGPVVFFLGGGLRFDFLRPILSSTVLNNTFPKGLTVVNIHQRVNVCYPAALANALTLPRYLLAFYLLHVIV